MHWDGTAWSLVGPVTTGTFTGSGTGPSDFWAVGRTVWHWDGATWTEIDIGSGDGARAVWARTPSDVWLIKDAISHHWDGTKWNAIVIDERQQGTGGDASVFGSGPDDVWASTLGSLYHWDGKTWTYRGQPPVSSLWGINGTFWGVGAQGAILEHQ